MMDVYKILLVCLAVLAINARQSTSLILKGSRGCDCYPSSKDGIHISNSGQNYDNGDGDATISQNQHISDTISNRNPSVFQIKPVSVNYVPSGVDLGSQHLHGGTGASYYDPSTEDELYAYELYNPDPHAIDMFHFNTDFNNLNLIIDNAAEDLLDKAATGNINVVGNNNQVPNYITDNSKYLHQESNALPTAATIPILSTSGVKSFTPVNVLPKQNGGHKILDNPLVSQGSGTNFVNSIPSLLTENKIAKPSQLNLKLSNSPVLDNWLFEEIKNVASSGPGVSIHTLDLQNFKIHLLNVLEQNRYFVAENGELLDVNGHRLQMSNLKLQRVMISDPAAHIQLLSGYNCVTADIPYLEAVFVSLVYPAKILGLIPLKMTSLPRCGGGGCSGQMCSHSPNNKHVTVNTRQPILLHLSPSRTGEVDDPLKSDPQVDSNVHNLAILSKLADVDHGVSDDHVGVEGGDKSEPVDDKDDGLGIRIIGGHAATSSGTPVSSRGRSAPHFG